MDDVHESSEGTKDDDAVKLQEFRKRMKWCRRNCPVQINQLVRQSDNPEMYQEEARRYNQAKLGKALISITARRLKQRQFFYKEYYPEWTMSKGYTPEEEEVQAKWNPHILPFELPLKKHEFHGSSGVFALTMFCLAGIVRTPFFVVALTEIEFVNLANLRVGETDMTIVLKDFTHDVFEISSVPSTSVTVIKDWFDIVGVKYYENREKHKWNDILQGIRENPQDFIDKGCWRSVNLESSAAADVSSDSYESSESEPDFDEEEEFPWEELFNECRSNSTKGE